MISDEIKISFDDILNLRQTSQFQELWNQYSLNHEKYDFVYREGENKKVIRLEVYDNDHDSRKTCRELKAIVAQIRHDRIQRLKGN